MSNESAIIVTEDHSLEYLILAVVVIVMMVLGVGGINYGMNRAHALEMKEIKAEHDLRLAQAKIDVQDIELKHWREAAVIATAAAGIAGEPTSEKLTAALNPCWKVAENDQALKKVCNATDGNPKIKIVVAEK